jgi:glutamate/tyrosine decarboxylase-like PLP-dependent enzyme
LVKVTSSERLNVTHDPDNPESLDPENWEEMRKLAHTMVDDAFQWLQTLRQKPVWEPMPNSVVQHFQTEAPKAPSSPESVYQDFTNNILRYPMGTPHPRFWAWYMGNGTVMGAMADFLASVMNSNVGGGNHIAIHVEAQVVSWLRDMMGFPTEASGLLTSGASMANLIALAVARNSIRDVDIRQEGVAAAAGPLVAYASKEVHSCMQKAVETLGLGSKALQLIEIHPDYTIDVEALGNQIRKDREAGKIPFVVIANAGTINTGAVDDMSAIADLCEAENIWFHVDGAIGAVAILASSVREQLRGMERADSVALDLHKWMHIPFEAGAVIVRDRTAHKDSFCLTPEYLQHDEKGRGLASGKHWFSEYGLQLTRQFRALKVWMSVKEHGLDRFGRMIDRNVAQAQYLGELIAEQSVLELTAPIGLDIVCFRYNPGGLDIEELNALNKAILVELQESGIAAPSYTTLAGEYCLRVAISNHRSLFADFDILVEEVLRIGGLMTKSSAEL